MPTELDSLKIQLQEARDAKHRLMTGKSPHEVVTQNGERVTYSRFNATQLDAYIFSLDARIKSLEGNPLRPIEVQF